MSKALVYRGEDRVMVLRVVFGPEKQPFDLTDITRFAVFFRQANAIGLHEINSDLKPAIPAVRSGVDNGASGTITFTAQVPGVIGNSIVLSFNGADDVDTVVNAWNTANPTNTVSSDAAGTEVPPAQTVTLAQGVDAFNPVTVVGNPILGKIQVIISETDTNLLKVGPNQNIKVHLDKGEPPAGERRVVIFRNVLDVEEGSI